MDRIKKAISNSSIVACVFITTGTCLPSHCLASPGNVFTELLPTNGPGTCSEPLPSRRLGMCLPSNCLATVGVGAGEYTESNVFLSTSL
jgi:hypothetical protein